MGPAARLLLLNNRNLRLAHPEVVVSLQERSRLCVGVAGGHDCEREGLASSLQEERRAGVI
jgi:hypothetical protein